MKCIETNNGKVIRIRDHMAASLVKKGYAKYIPKERWKRLVRDAPK